MRGVRFSNSVALASLWASYASAAGVEMRMSVMMAHKLFMAAIQDTVDAASAALGCTPADLEGKGCGVTVRLFLEDDRTSKIQGMWGPCRMVKSVQLAVEDDWHRYESGRGPQDYADRMVEMTSQLFRQAPPGSTGVIEFVIAANPDDLAS